MDRVFLFIFSLILIATHKIKAEEILPVGCFEYDLESAEFSYRSPHEARAITVEACVEKCREKEIRYAGLYGGNTCLCGEAISSSISDQCTFKCSENSTQSCGGPKVMNVYETGHGILGAPVSLKLISSESRSFEIAWEPPKSGLSQILEYKVTAELVKSFSEVKPPGKIEWTFSTLTKKGKLTGVHPGTQYLIEVQAGDKVGLGYGKTIKAWTKVGKPNIPQAPELISVTGETRIVELKKVMASNGPISDYRIVVVDETVPVIIQYDLLKEYYKASSQNIPFYIAAEFPAEEFESVFTVGDSKVYNGYYNAPLTSGKDYHILLGVLSTLNNETEYSYSLSDHSQHESSHIEHFHEHRELHHPHLTTQHVENPNKGLVLGLSIAVGLFGFLLFVSVVVYFSLRVYLKKSRRRTGENEELAIHAQIPHQDYENGYAVGAHFVEDEEPQVDHYKQLKERVKIISPQNLNIVGEVGIGKFGNVKKAVINNKGHQMNALVQQIADDSLSTSSKTQMLREFSGHVNIGNHIHIVSLLGLVEELNAISVVFEYETGSFKTQLIESRACQHYPVYAEKNRRFSTLPENKVS